MITYQELGRLVLWGTIVSNHCERRLKLLARSLTERKVCFSQLKVECCERLERWINCIVLSFIVD